MPQRSRVFFDISIGNSAEYNAKKEKYDRAVSFFKAKGSSFGLSGSSLEDLSDAELETLRELYQSDPTYSKQGDILTTAPPSLHAGRIVMELFDDEVPKTAENFKCLCTGEKGKGKESGKLLHYKGNKFHRIVKGFVCQGGDVTRGDGSGGESIFGKKFFNDEKAGLKLKHDSAGVLSMANSGKNSNSSQFFFTLAPAPQLDGKHVVFGKIVSGMEVLEKMAQAGTADGTPTTDVVITNCGVC